jgi:hypothetical protein
MSEQVVPSALKQNIIVKFLTNEKLVQILTRLRDSVMKRSKGPRYMTE